MKNFIDALWSESILPVLTEYIRIPNQSPAFDAEWQASGHMDRAVDLLADWVRVQPVAGLELEVVRLEGRTPLLYVEIPGSGEETVLLYGHLDKQPPMDGWREGFGPWEPVLSEDRLFGRGGADDGYSVFAAISAIAALQKHGVPHARCVVLIEACEESGSPDLPSYIEFLAGRTGAPNLVICLDSGCGNYDQMWVTTSLRGLVTGDLTVSTLTEGVHSGSAGGVVPSTFRIARHLLGRLEDEEDGRILLAELHDGVPPDRVEQATAAAAVLGASVHQAYPFAPGVTPQTLDVTELILNRTWRPSLEVTGAEGLPALRSAGNVLRPTTTLKLSLRLPPTVSPSTAAAAIKRRLEEDPPHGARVTFDSEGGAAGWNASPIESWLADSLRRASCEFFGREACYLGEGGSIPFMAMLGAKFPRAQFVITGVLGPRSNAHGPNEFLHLPTARKLTGCVARVLADHRSRHSSPDS